MHPDLREHLQRWTAVGLLDEATAARIAAYEAASPAEAHPGEAARRLHWPIVLALALGAVMIGAGVLLFVAAHWDRLGPGMRFASVLGMVGAFHGAGAGATDRFPRLATALHGLGTAALGAGIFMAGQIFHLQEHWPGGLMLWALGAWLGHALLRDWVQGSLGALLTPAWILGEWLVWLERRDCSDTNDLGRVSIAALFLLALTYLTGRRTSKDSAFRKALGWVGGLALLPLGIALLAAATERGGRLIGTVALPWTALATSIAVAVLLCLGVALRLRGRAAVWNLVAVLWVLPLLLVPFRGAWSYVHAGLGSVALAAWGLGESRPERVNLGVAGFAITVTVFYFSSVMDKLGRSLGLMGLGLLFLGGGWLLERTRRRLLGRIREGER